MLVSVRRQITSALELAQTGFGLHSRLSQKPPSLQDFPQAPQFKSSKSRSAQSPLQHVPAWLEVAESAHQPPTSPAGQASVPQ
jgi:hypothetical protein